MAKHGKDQNSDNEQSGGDKLGKHTKSAFNDKQKSVDEVKGKGGKGGKS